MHYSTNGGATYSWMKSASMKQSLALCAPAVLHQRLYAPNGRFYSTSWGYYVLGTTHYDYYESCPGGWSGKSEDAEKAVCQDWQLWVGDYCFYNGGKNFANAMPNQLVDHHRWKNNGTASEALVP